LLVVNLQKLKDLGSFTSGYYTSASGDYQTVAGTFNELNTSPNAFIVGGGTSLGSGLKTLVFASGSQFQLSGSFAPQYRNIGSVEVATVSSGILLTNRDYNIAFTAGIVAMGNKNAIQLPSNIPIGTIIYLQRVSGTTTCTVSGSSGHTINGAAGYTFPTTVYARRMFVFNGSGWFVEPTTIA
jgi:hypothetical protein